MRDFRKELEKGGMTDFQGEMLDTLDEQVQIVTDLNGQLKLSEDNLNLKDKEIKELEGELKKYKENPLLILNSDTGEITLPLDVVQLEKERDRFEERIIKLVATQDRMEEVWDNRFSIEEVKAGMRKAWPWNGEKVWKPLKIELLKSRGDKDK